ncbi:hypothetical protein KAH37_07035 [bacterium]|nr:hypothetical protein [bacterium]
MSDKQKWESILSSVIEEGQRKKRQRVIVALSSVATLFLLVFSIMLYQPTENDNTIDQQRIAINDPELDMEMALMEQGIIVDDIGIIY